MSGNNCAVYVHVNLINGKKYFGITTHEPEKRWQNGNGYYNNAHFTNAIKKYGWDGFAHYVLYRNIPINIAKNIEEMLIKEHFTHDPRFGYNKTYGGELERHTKESCQKISEAKKELYKNHPEANPMYGKFGADNPTSKPVEAINPETGERVYYFESMNDAGRAGFSQGHVCECCNGKRKTHKGFVWRHVEGEVNDDGGYN